MSIMSLLTFYSNKIIFLYLLGWCRRNTFLKKVPSYCWNNLNYWSLFKTIVGLILVRFYEYIRAARSLLFDNLNFFCFRWQVLLFIIRVRSSLLFKQMPIFFSNNLCCWVVDSQVLCCLNNKKKFTYFIVVPSSYKI